MSGEHFSGGQMPHEPIGRLPLDVYDAVERNVVYACTDVVLRDASTGKIFLGDRQTEPQVGPWLVGGRNAYAAGIDENAAMQVENDLGMTVSKDRFAHVATYSTDFPIAAPGREDHGRHTVNAVMLVDLKPQETASLNSRIDNHELRDEYSGGGWYTAAEIADPQSDFPWAIKQLVRDIATYDTTRGAIWDAAHAENAAREAAPAEFSTEQAKQAQVVALSQVFQLSETDANALVDAGGKQASKYVLWAQKASNNGSAALTETLASISNDPSIGDVDVSGMLATAAIEQPPVVSENGPALRAALSTALLALALDKQTEGALFKRVALVAPLVSEAA